MIAAWALLRLETMDVVVAHGEAAHLDLTAHAIDTKREAYGRLLILVDETKASVL